MNFFKTSDFWLFFFLAVNAFLIFFNPLLPFIDLPNHLAEATIYRYYNDPGNSFSTYYDLVPWYFPNLFYLWFCVVDIFPTIEFANKVYLLLYSILLPLSLHLIIKELKGNTWIALFSFTFIYGYNMTFGFVGYVMAIPIIFLLFYLMLVDYRVNKWWLKLTHALLLILLFTMHAQAALFGLLIYGVCGAYRYRKSFKNLAISLVASLPLALAIINWWVAKGGQEEESTLSFLFSYYSNTFFTTFIERFGLVAFENFQLREGLFGIVIAILFSFSIVLPMLIRARENSKKSTRLFFEGMNRYAFLLLFMAIGCYFFLPNELPGQAPISQRFGVLVLLAFIIVLSLYTSYFKRMWHKIYVIGVLVIYSFLWGEYITTFNSINKDFNAKLFSGLANDKKLSGIIYDYTYRGRGAYMHFQNYFIIWRKGIASSKIIDYRFGVVRRKVDVDELPEYYDWSQRSKLKKLVEANLDYLLVRDHNEDVQLENFQLLEDRNKWAIFGRRNLVTSERISQNYSSENN